MKRKITQQEVIKKLMQAKQSLATMAEVIVYLAHDEKNALEGVEAFADDLRKLIRQRYKPTVH